MLWDVVFMKCDVLIVGAGPAGSGAAKAAAENGAKTICIDKKLVIGLPVECGEAVGLGLPKEFGIKIAPEAICMKHKGTVFWANQEVKIDNCSPIWKSMSVNRHIMDKSFAIDAARSGAKVLVNSELIDSEIEDKIIKSVTVSHKGYEISIIPKIVIAADGINSKIAEMLGRRKFKDIEIGKVAGYEMTNLNLREKNKIQMFFEEMCGMGYGYIIPKSRDSANVGFGSLGIKKAPWDAFNDFLEEHPIVAPQVKHASIIEVKSGEAPISGPLSDSYLGNAMFVGDAAGQNLSHVGEGAVPSHICGRIAGKIAADVVKSKNIQNISIYPKMINDALGPLFNHCDSIRENIIKIWTSKLPVEKRFLIGTVLVSELIPPNNKELLDRFERIDVSDVVNETSLLIRKENIEANITSNQF